MDITILNICRLPENSNLLQQLCISQFQLRPAIPTPHPPGLTSGISIFLPWMAVRSKCGPALLGVT